MTKAKKLWRPTVTAEDLEAASGFLSLLYSADGVQQLTRQLRRGSNHRGEAKDLLRASKMPLLPKDEPHVADDLKKIQKKKLLSPVLLVRGDVARGVPLMIADGYHRICAVYHFDEDAPIAYRISAPRPGGR
jgi:hypothetical protein